MSEGEVKIRVKLDADEATRKTKQFSAANKDLGNSVEKTGDQSERSAKKHGIFKDAISGMKGAFAGLVGSLVGTAGLNFAMNIYNERMEKSNELIKKNTQLTREAIQSRLDLVSLSGFEDPEKVALIGQAAFKAGRGAPETARTLTMIESALPGATNEQRGELLMRVALKAQQSESTMQAWPTRS